MYRLPITIPPTVRDYLLYQSEHEEKSMAAVVIEAIKRSEGYKDWAFDLKTAEINAELKKVIGGGE